MTPIMIDRTQFILDMLFILSGIILLTIDLYLYLQVNTWTILNTGILIIALMIIIMGTVSLVSDIRDAVRRAKLFDRQV